MDLNLKTNLVCERGVTKGKQIDEKEKRQRKKKKAMMYSYVISILLYGRKYWTIFSERFRKLESTEMYFC